MAADEKWTNSGRVGGADADLETAIRLAAEDKQWDVVRMLGRELEARRLARAGNVVKLDTSRRRGDK